MEKVGFHKLYNLRRPVLDQRSIEVIFPFEVVELAAQRRGITVDELMKQCQVDVTYDTTEMVTYSIVDRPSKD